VAPSHLDRVSVVITAMPDRDTVRMVVPAWRPEAFDRPAALVPHDLLPDSDKKRDLPKLLIAHVNLDATHVDELVVEGVEPGLLSNPVPPDVAAGPSARQAASDAMLREQAQPPRRDDEAHCDSQPERMIA
jgi:hypothetical protein